MKGRIRRVRHVATSMFVRKRGQYQRINFTFHQTHTDNYVDGRQERVQFDKITARVSRLCYGLDTDHIDPVAITQKVISGVYGGVTTVQLDDLLGPQAAETAAYMTVTHPDYAILAALSDLYHYVNPKNGTPSPMIAKETYECVMRHKEELDSAIVYDRDFNYQYFGFKTLERSYLLKLDGQIVERPQHMIMRVSVGIWGDNVERVIETYNLMSAKFFTHASPTLFNADCYGEEFEILYERYEKEGRGRKTIKAQKLWYAILEAQTETGNPFMLYKDHCNRKSNQKNLGTIRSSNLCTEIIEYSAPDEVAVCNLASLALPSYVDYGKGVYDFEKLHDVTKVVVRNLNKIIDVNYYPVQEARNSNMRHRPIGVGVQGLADAFLALRMPFESPEARQLNIQIFETIYHAALEASMELAKEQGTYSTYKGSPVSQGILQYDMWNVKPSDLWNWEALKEQIKQHGVRNSLLLAPMPTASTSQILGNNECFEPYTSNIYQRRVLAGEFQVVNPWLLRDLVDLGLWSDAMKNRIIAEGGSIQNIPSIPDDIKALYKTVWEISQRTVVQMAADRGAFIDQSQSLNIHMREPSMGKITSMHFTGWKLGLKTGMYYLRTQAAAAPIQFTVDQEALRVADPNVAKDRSQLKKRAPPSGGYSSSNPTARRSVPGTRNESARNSDDAPGQSVTESPTAAQSELKRQVPLVKADAAEGGSPKNLATEPNGAMPSEELPNLNGKTDPQDEDLDEDSKEREMDIYSEAVIACSIENPEACVMCSG
ncbi:unnamed protein product [Parascedosporium putredinis]|uniref:ATP-cone domain-containing protein n=1 Tax=Parascedosporium putredinis TaxID=1442378 RepID=A0A9P1GW45_9PEZI|nr:unnamed protein product [Parascedosporium putredinis]CAI7989179.1 unnamed protein product [Parascedosporium putredinis]